MSKTLKKALSVVLVIIMALSVMPMAFAAQEQEVKYNEEPIVIVRGIDFAGLVDEDGNKAISISVGKVLNLVMNIGLNKFRRNEQAVLDAIVSFGLDVLGDIKCDEYGNPVKSDVHIPKFLHSAEGMDLSGAEWSDTAVGLFREVAQQYDASRTYLYTFDWRMSPDALADDLKSFFDLVLAETGAEKLDIAACSMGGMITTSYINKYGTDILDTVTYLSSAHNGGDVVGAAFTGDLVIDGAFLGDFAVAKTSGNFALNLLVRMLNGLGIIKSLGNYVGEVVANNKEVLYNDLLAECFRTAFGLWALVPDEYFDAAYDLFYANAGSEFDYARGEIAKVKKFVTSTEDIIAKAVNSDTKVTFVSHYDREQLPIYTKCTSHGDGVLESARTSGFATFAKVGTTLTDAEIAGVEAEYISPDKIVNAKTALYPERTWIIKDAGHVGCKAGSEHTEFAIWLLTNDEQPTVSTNAKYPRFMACDANENFIGF